MQKMKNKMTPLIGILTLALAAGAAPPKKLNILVITADDMNWNSVGCFGSPMKDTTPNIDKLASQGMRFDHAHVATTVCMPSRNALNSGRLPHRSGGEGFHHFRFPNIPTIPSVLTKNGYKVGVLGKVAHSTPYEDTPWDMAEEMGRNTELFYEKSAAFIDSAQKEGKPFYLIVNSHDPHRPYYNHKLEGTPLKSRKGKPADSHPSRVFHPDEVFVPGFLPDIAPVREELADYYSSVRRCDDVVGRMLDLIDDKKLADNTMVVYWSDHGMAAPSAKANAYLNSTKTPLIIRWPKHIQPGSVDSQNFVSIMDIFPTILAATHIKSPGGFDGISLMPAFKGEKLKDRGELFFTQFYATIGKSQFNMRTALTHQFSYTFNTFYNGDRLYNSSSLGGNFFKSMVALGKTDPKWAARAEFILRRAPEELYDIQKDPDCMNNLAGSPEYAEVMKKFRKAMATHMKATNDPVEPVFDTYQATDSIEAMRKSYEQVMEDSGLIGRIPREVDMEKWTDPKAFKAKKDAAKTKRKKK